jgi:prepilin-type N-terminal cleavage/methylation domain-containing protein
MHTKNNGFTLIELLLVVVIIGILLAVIVPRAWRANVDAKYGLVRQNATELVAFAHEWAEQQIQANPPGSGANISRYFATLSENNTSSWIGGGSGPNGSNWNTNFPNKNVADRDGTGTPSVPTASVQEIVPVERLPRNPFNGASVFATINNPTGQNTVIPGALNCGFAFLGGTGPRYYALIFLGTDSTLSGAATALANFTFHAGMGRDLPGLRNGVFMAQISH